VTVRIAYDAFASRARMEREAHADEIQPQAFILARNK
jgi:hypothetical protein